ncbi:MAG: LysE family translocator [Humidesulfovibrio sp.]|uniref:LysE family translocator n=1 Tax=Humidesulfovibrio sp. TaxID=2910988 RepID=UPI0027F49CB0|nr:LysE family translocator [Humidesulfovibrio sp.]MDQ7834125.1 LysE family translocator [Humidesulfovibrio sp.]
MTTQLLVSLCLFAFVTSATPGPNNAMLFSSGVNYGFRRTLPHLMGVTLGFTFMQLALGLGVGIVFETVPGLYSVLRVLGLAYMLYLAWAIGTAVPPLANNETSAAAKDTAKGTPMTFLQATAFQWVNPKALMMCITAASTYAPPDQPILGALIVTAAFLVVGMPCCGAWAALGSLMRGFMQDRRRLRVFNVAMAFALVASMAPMAGDLLSGNLF